MNTDGIRTLASVIAIISTIFFAFGFNKDDLTIWSDYKWLRWISSIILISSFLYLLFAETLSKLWTSFIMKKRHLKGAVISKRYTQVEIMDNSGKIAHLFQKIHFEKIKNGEYITNTQCDMSVKESYIDMNMTQTANCSVEVLENRKQLCVYFKDNIEKLNKKSSLFRVDKFLYYKSLFKFYSITFL